MPAFENPMPLTDNRLVTAREKTTEREAFWIFLQALASPQTSSILVQHTSAVMSLPSDVCQQTCSR